MHPYIPHTKEQIEEMLEGIGVKSIDDLFSVIPEEIRLNESWNIPAGLTEMELIDHMKGLAQKNKSTDDLICFLGGGVYDHYIPSVIDALISRQEFYTAYTPYQPEISQGVLQAIFEYQTMICELTGLDVSNASMYDGASTLAEACIIAYASFRDRNKILMAKTVHPQSKQTVQTYTKQKKLEVSEIGWKNGQLDLDELEKQCTDEVAAVCVQTPNFFGVIEDLEAIAKIAKEKKALLIVSTDPLSLGVLEAPGKFGADFVVGEGVNMGNPISFGGPYLGFIAADKKHMRKMPGRIVGQTTDSEGKRGFVLTLQAREQHIRREKATSNICSNQALCALTATVYLSVIGKKGLKEIGMRCMSHAHYTQQELMKTQKFEPLFDAPFFKEFLLKSKEDPQKLNQRLLKEGYLGGYCIEKDHPELKNGWLVAVTEKRTKQQMDDFVQKAGE